MKVLHEGIVNLKVMQKKNDASKMLFCVRKINK